MQVNIDIIKIKELEKYLVNPSKSKARWSQNEDAILLRYYGSAPINALMVHLPGRSYDAIRQRYSKLKLSRTSDDVFVKEE